ncbi:winged helix DNA-binding protein [Trinickia sp. LjRoot230]|uniref:MarR family winged helix-turn-helix transcriptional regulator n=1 Tax=Trinickia sp. LjRoot230 TaxID=3342288 RepID=UPI003ECFE139
MNRPNDLLNQATRLRAQITGLARRLRQEAQLDPVQYSQLVVMGAIDRLGNGVTPSAICAAERIRSSNLAVLLRELEAAGYVKRDIDAEDRRRARLSLTTAGRRMLHGNRTVRGQWLASAMLECLSVDERAVVLKAGELLERLAQLGHEPQPQTPASIKRKRP